MTYPPCFEAVPECEDLMRQISQLGYQGAAHFVAFWWDEADNQLAWADSNLKFSVGIGDDGTWHHLVGRYFCDRLLGSIGDKAQQVLVWDRRSDRVWVAPRLEGLLFLGREKMAKLYGNGRAT